MRISVLDLGSHSFHLLSAEVRDGALKPLADAKVAVRIGERAFTEGWIPQSAVARGLQAIEELIAPLGGRVPLAVATAVFREARNAGAFLGEVQRRCGIDVRILSGREEAELTYRAACAEVLDPDARLAVFDLGGGSLECMLGEHRRVEIAGSYPLGALRLAMHVGRADLVAGVERLVAAHAGATLEAIRRRDPELVVFTSGTARTLLRVARTLGHAELVRGCISSAALSSLAGRLSTMTVAELSAIGVPAARYDTIAAGALVFSAITRHLDVPFVRIAQGALREGLVLQVAERHERAASVPLTLHG